MKKRALISVSDKTGIETFAKGLINLGFEIISTGGTAQYLKKQGLAITPIEEVTHFQEMLDGRVKTLHPAIHGGLLARRDKKEHLKALEDADIQMIDLVCVNLYPFKETISKPETTLAQAVEQIDIGGPSMLRSGAKNFDAVTVVCDPADYQEVLDELLKKGDTTLETRKRLAAKVFSQTASYDSLIANYLTTEEFPTNLTFSYQKKQLLRYGENPQQQAAFYENNLPSAFSLSQAQQLHGKALSYNNLKDANAALLISRAYDGAKTAVAVKHMNPCGIGQGETIEEAFAACYEADPISIFGGIVVLNDEVTLAVAEKLHQLFLEIVIAPSYEQKALELLEKKKNLRLLTLDFTKPVAKEWETVSVLGGLLVQEADTKEEEMTDWQVVTEEKPTCEELKAMAFAFKACQFVKSNAIVIANDHQTLGIGAGQMNRVGSVKIALEQAKGKLKGAVLASDAFFPMADSVEYAATHGIKAIVQPGGSIKDQDSIEMANRYGISMVFTGTRHFKH